MQISISKLRSDLKHYLQLVQEGELLEVIDGRVSSSEGKIIAILVQEDAIAKLKDQLRVNKEYIGYLEKKLK
jgi:hypothetical protein